MVKYQVNSKQQDVKKPLWIELIENQYHPITEVKAKKTM